MNCRFLFDAATLRILPTWADVAKHHIDPFYQNKVSLTIHMQNLALRSAMRSGNHLDGFIFLHMVGHESAPFYLLCSNPMDTAPFGTV